MKHLLTLLSVAGLAAVSVSVCQAQPYAIAGNFNGWNNNAPLGGGPTIYTNLMTGGTPGTFQGCKIIAVPGSWSLTYPGNNLELSYDVDGNNTVYFYPGTFTDGWQPVQNRVGFDDPGNMSFEIAGDFTNPNWSSDPNAQMTAAGNGVYTNTYVIASAGAHGFKFRTPNSWNDFNCGADFGGGANATVTTTQANQVIFFQLDLPNGRWLAGNLAPKPVTNYVVFAVDMSSQIELGQFTPGSSVYVAGTFNSWSGPPGGLALTNEPPYNGGSNTNIYYGTNIFVDVPSSSTTQYKFTDNDPAALNGGWEQSDNRTFTMLATNGTLLLPVVSFNNKVASDYLTADTVVTFSVNMNGAQTAVGLTPVISPAVSFDGTAMQVFMSGNFMDNGWAPNWQSFNLVQLSENPVGSGIYTYQWTVKAGHPLEVHYKYGFDDGIDSIDNEAPAGQNHVRIIRTPASGSYDMPLDTYGNQHVEPPFGGLTVSPATGGNVRVQWLGRPGLHLQASDSVTGSWTDHVETDGAVWIGSTNNTSDGTATITNMPAGGKAGFFRLIKPN